MTVGPLFIPALGFEGVAYIDKLSSNKGGNWDMLKYVEPSATASPSVLEGYPATCLLILFQYIHVSY